MSIQPLIQLNRDDFGNRETLLRKMTAPVSDFGSPLQRAIADLLETFKSHKIAVGLAAPQIGLPLRVTVINTKKDKADPTTILVNPRITNTSRQTESKFESCMSLPHFRGQVDRPVKITLSYQDELGKPHNMKAEGFLARVICHEVDHLNGVLYIDRMVDLSKLEPVEFFKDD